MPHKVKLLTGMKAFSSSRLLRFVLAPLLSIWVAGAGCMLGCESMVAAATTVKTDSTHHLKQSSKIVASGHACSSQKPHDCCQKSHDEIRPKAPQSSSLNTALTASGRSSSVPTSCPFAVSRTAVVTKAQGGDKSVSALLVKTSRPAQIFLEQPAPLSPPLRMPNRGHTYLRCCVFLI